MISITEILATQYQATGQQAIRAALVGDTVADLPADSTDVLGYTLLQGSTCHIIADSTVYMMQSTGTWIQQLSELDADVYTRQQIDQMIQRLETVQASQAAEIGVIANLGAKNILQITRYQPGQSATSNGRTFTVQADGGVLITGDPSGASYADFYLAGAWTDPTVQLDLSDAEYTLSLSSDPELATSAVYVRVLDRRGGTSAESATATLAATQKVFSFPVTVALITVQPAAQIPAGGLIVYPMIRRAEIKDATYQPYAPTNRQLYEMI